MPCSQKVVQDVLEGKAADLQLYSMAIRWVKNRLTDFRVDERRKVHARCIASNQKYFTHVYCMIAQCPAVVWNQSVWTPHKQRFPVSGANHH